MTGVKKLPIAKSPIVGFTEFAYPLSVILNYEECYPWFYSNFIQLVWDKDMKRHLNFYLPATAKMPEMAYIPWLDIQMIKKNTLTKNHIDLIDFIINSIDEGYYICAFFDEFYVPVRQSYQTKNYYHDFLIVGYNTNKRIFYVLGYSQNAIFETTEISFEQFMQALYSNKGSEKVVELWYDQIILLRKSDNCAYEFDLKNVYESLQSYLSKADSSEVLRIYEKPLNNRIYGMDIYPYLKKYFNLLIEDKVKYDFRPLHILYEHKKCMVLRLEYMNRNKCVKDISNIISTYVYIENNMLDARNLQIKYMLDYKSKSLYKIIDKLDEIEALEKKTLDTLLEHIRNEL